MVCTNGFTGPLVHQQNPNIQMSSIYMSHVMIMSCLSKDWMYKKVHLVTVSLLCTLEAMAIHGPFHGPDPTSNPLISSSPRVQPGCHHLNHTDLGPLAAFRIASGRKSIICQCIMLYHHIVLS